MVHTLNFHIQDSKLQKESRNYMPARAEQYIKIHKKAFTISINKHTTYFDMEAELQTGTERCGSVLEMTSLELSNSVIIFYNK